MEEPRRYFMRYFIQRLLMHFGRYDKKLIELKIAHKVGQLDPDHIRNFKEIKSPWASNLPISAKTERDDSHHLSINVPEEYPPKDGYENSRQLNVMARTILICKDLVILWKDIGYYQIYSDVNDLVMQGALLILFPPTPSCGYVRPNVNRVNERLEELIKLGFDLTYNVIGITIKELLEKILVESIKPERNLKKAKKFSSKIEYQEEAFRKAMTEYMEYTNESSNIANNSDNDDNTEDVPKQFITSLKLLPKFYSWILKTFGANADTTKACFDDILKTRVRKKCKHGDCQDNGRFIHYIPDLHSKAASSSAKVNRQAQALFHAVRLGPNFINVQVVKVMLANDGLLSRYFIQRLLMHFGRYDKKLIELKIAHNVGQIDPDRIQNFKEKTKSPGQELAPKGNYMELFHFLSSGPHVISEAPAILSKNNDSLKKYPPKDGYENSRQLNVMARTILICKDLVILWKDIGYYQICSDVNDLVMQGALLILFPPTPSCGYVCPDVNRVNERLEELIKPGFDLTYNVIGDIMQIFENRLSDVGGIFLESFVKIKGITVKELLEKIQ
ncbi:1921_t:CDS:2 [Acaulospora morrowiae]|uniref:1921_t:CDS:1 n=1 Tax=Acaulospora morrowiae TaxID=94023 RepID=A0A9N8VWS0_9GLOM|nr:1921_t:CDS:2 [Acaulospora morrowiae]